MPNPKFNFTRLFTLFAIAVVVVFISSLLTFKTYAITGINRQINFQGKLVNNPTSTNVNDTSYTVIFTFYDAPTGGTALWTETQTVTTKDGIFRVALGSVTPFPANFNFNWSGLYLGIKVNSDSEMTPRIQMAAVPFAFNSQRVAGLTVQDSTSGAASTSAILKLGDATTSKTFDLGTNNLTFSTSGDTTLTLPTSGTVCVNSNNCGYLTSAVNWWNQVGGLVYPTSSLYDFAIGGTSTTSALFSYTGIQSATHQTIASVSGQLTVMPNNGYGGKVGIGYTDPGVASLAVNGKVGIGTNAPGNYSLSSTGEIFSSASFGWGTSEPGTLSWAASTAILRSNANKDLTFETNGVNEKARITTIGNFGLGTTSPASEFHVTRPLTLAANGKALVIFDQIENQDIFTASASGTPIFTITRSGGISLGTNGLNIGTGSQCITGGATAGWGSCGGGPGGPSVNWWNQVGGLVYPTDPTYDFAVGGTATTSALFSYTGIQSGSPLASVSGNLVVMPYTNGATEYGGTLTVGGIPGFANAVANFGGDVNGYVQVNVQNRSAGNGASSDFIATADNGDDSTNYIDFGINSSGYNQAAYNIGGANDGYLYTSNGDLTVGTASNRNLIFHTGGTTQANQRMIIAQNGTVGLGTGFGAAPGAELFVTRPLSFGATGKALVVLNQIENQDIFTASVGGATKFVITNSGQVDLIGGVSGSDIDTIGINSLKIGGVRANSLLFGNSTVSTLTLNVDTAGNFVFQKEGSAFSCSGTDKLTLDGSGNLVCSSDINTPNANWWNQVSGLVYPTSSLYDFAIGGTATTSALFSYTGIQSTTHKTIASVSGNLIVNANNGFGGSASLSAGLVLGSNADTSFVPTIQSTKNEGLTIGGNTTGNITFLPINGAGNVTIGSTSNGLVFDTATGTQIFYGTARPTKQIVLSPEYAGAAITASGSATTNGNMTSDASPSANFRTYYEWSSTQNPLQDYQIAVRVTLPKDFSAWSVGTTAMQVNYNTDSSVVATNKVDVIVYNPSFSTSSPALYRSGLASTSWTTVDVADTQLSNWATAGQTATIYLKMYASGTYNKSRVGDIVLNYLAKF